MRRTIFWWAVAVGLALTVGLYGSCDSRGPAYDVGRWC